MEFFNQITDPYTKVLWIVTLSASLIFVIQSVMSFFGGDDGYSDTDIDLESPLDSFEWFTLRNLIHFLIGFGWTSIALSGTVTDMLILIVLSVAVGAFLVWLFFWVSFKLQALAQDNTMRISEAVGRVGEVYLQVPQQKSGRGKLHISIRNTLRELDAVTEGDTIPTGASARVVDVIDNQVLVVERE
jgi:hypothetical protein